jgi:hypothetical protein
MHRETSRCFPPAAFAATALLLVTGGGCGLGAPATTVLEPQAVSTSLSGHVRGGEAPIVGADVYLYATTNGGYPSSGSGGVQLLHTTSNGSGDFSFNNSSGMTQFTCPSGQAEQTYMFAVGGNSGSNAVNSQIVELAATGPCSGLTSGTSVTINEVTTTASAYALANFLYVDTSTSPTTVRISAPANNNVVTGGATAGSSSGPGAAGLPHAFLNVPQLVSIATGSANTATPLTGSGLGQNNGTVTGVVPAAEINTIGDILQSCVNSSGTTPPAILGYTGGSTAATAATVTLLGSSDSISGTFEITDNGTATSTTALTTLSALATYINGNANFMSEGITASASGTTLTISDAGANTMDFTGSTLKDTPPSSNTSTETSCGSLFALALSRSGTAPTTSLQAALNMAQNPTLNVSSIYSLAASSTAFQPTLSSAPFDWDIAIVYPLTNVFTDGKVAGFDLNLDANDNVYADLSDVGSLVSDVATTPGALIGFTSNGENFMLNTSSISTASSEGQIREIALDENGNLLLANISATYAVMQFNAATGNLVNYFTNGTAAQNTGIAVDRANNVWLALSRSATNGYKLGYVSAGNTFGTYTATKPVGTPEQVSHVTVDPDQNIWFTTGDNAGGTGASTENANQAVYVWQNKGTAAIPSYGTTSASWITGTINGQDATGLAFDSSGNAYVPNASTGSGTTTELQQLVPTLSSASVTAVSTVNVLVNPLYTVAETASTNPNDPRLDEVDGASVVWTPDVATGAIFGYTTAGVSVASSPGIIPCYVVSGACAAVGTTGAVTYPRTVRLDSTGAMWTLYSSQNNSTKVSAVAQIFGAGAPVWPLMQLGLPGVKPQ